MNIVVGHTVAHDLRLKPGIDKTYSKVMRKFPLNFLRLRKSSLRTNAVLMGNHKNS